MTDQSQSLRMRAANGARWTATSASVSVILQIAQLAILGRLLGPSEFGLMAMMMVVVGLLSSIADFGLGNYLVQKETLSQKTLIDLLMIAAAVSMLLAVVIALSSSLFAEYYKQPMLAQFLPWLSISIVIFTISQMLMSVLQRFFAFKEIAIAEIGSAILALAGTTLLARSGYGVWSLVIGQLLAGSARATIFALPLIGLIRQLPKYEKTKLFKARIFAMYQTGERLSNYLGWNLDKIIIGRFLGNVDLGLYSVAYQLMIRPFSALNPIFTRVTLPLFVKIRDNDVRLGVAYLQTIRTVALLMFPIYMVMAISAPAIINIVMGDKWSASAPILYVLSLLGIFFSIGNPIGTLILAKGKPKWAFNLNLFSLLIYALAFWIGSQYSVLGVAIAFLVAGLVVVYPIEFYLRYRLVTMSVVQYFMAMRHLFIAVIIPLSIHAIFCLTISETFSLVSQILIAMLAVVFFFSYLFLYDRSLIISTKNIVLKGV